MHECGSAGSARHHLVGSASCSLACPIPQSSTSLGVPAAALLQILSAWLPVSAPPTGLDECFFFISLVVRLPYSLIFCQFWLFLFLNCCCPSFGCARRHSVSTYSSILAKSPSVCRFINLIFLVIVVLVEFSSSSLGCYSLRNCPGSRHFPILQLTLKCNIMSEDPNELELSFGGWGHCSTGFPSVSVY